MVEGTDKKTLDEYAYIRGLTPQEAYRRITNGDCPGARIVSQNGEEYVVSEGATSSREGAESPSVAPPSPAPNSSRSSVTTAAFRSYEGFRLVADGGILVGGTIALVCAFLLIKGFTESTIFMIAVGGLGVIGGVMIIMTSALAKAVFDVADNTRRIAASN